MITLASGLEYVPIPTLAIVVGGVIAVTGIVFGAMRQIMVNRQKEQTKRELAAYVAEGSMTPEDAERIANSAGGHKRG